MNDIEQSRMPGAGDCIVDPRKITQYLLSETHEFGRGKARFFKSFGFLPDDWQRLADALCAHPLNNAVVWSGESEFGVKFVVRCTLDSPDGRNPCVDTIWISEGGGAPRFVTSYPYEN